MSGETAFRQRAGHPPHRHQAEPGKPLSLTTSLRIRRTAGPSTDRRGQPCPVLGLAHEDSRAPHRLHRVVIGIPASVIAVVQLAQAVRRAVSRHAEAPAVKPALASAAPGTANLQLYCLGHSQAKGSSHRPVPGVYREAYKRLIEHRGRQDPTA